MASSEAKTVVRLSVGCGWCMTGEHTSCKLAVTGMHIWICGCSCADERYALHYGEGSKGERDGVISEEDVFTEPRSTSATNLELEPEASATSTPRPGKGKSQGAQTPKGRTRTSR